MAVLQNSKELTLTLACGLDGIASHKLPNSPQPPLVFASDYASTKWSCQVCPEVQATYSFSSDKKIIVIYFF